MAASNVEGAFTNFVQSTPLGQINFGSMLAPFQNFTNNVQRGVNNTQNNLQHGAQTFIGDIANTLGSIPVVGGVIQSVGDALDGVVGGAMSK